MGMRVCVCGMCVQCSVYVYAVILRVCVGGGACPYSQDFKCGWVWGGGGLYEKSESFWKIFPGGEQAQKKTRHPDLLAYIQACIISFLLYGKGFPINCCVFFISFYGKSAPLPVCVCVCVCVWGGGVIRHQGRNHEFLEFVGIFKLTSQNKTLRRGLTSPPPPDLPLDPQPVGGHVYALLCEMCVLVGGGGAYRSVRGYTNAGRTRRL